jgi:hypothetical protein
MPVLVRRVVHQIGDTIYSERLKRLVETCRCEFMEYSDVCYIGKKEAARQRRVSRDRQLETRYIYETKTRQTARTHLEPSCVLE